ncbi:MAG: glycosyltransferase family 2 protein [Lachnospiraceae bacterium]|nr:glycosyltransferase family 2 protein [Lachnospiraceae bacterium]
MKLLSVAVPCYNSQDYMEHCVRTLLSGGADMEILIVDDGSKDQTAAIADRLAAEHPDVIRAIHQENAGHGGAVMTGIKHASGTYFKVVDSDDWLDEEALQTVLAKLREFAQMDQPVDLVVSNYIYDKVGTRRKRAIRYRRAFEANKILSWDEVGHFRKWENLLMHAMIYRTAILHESGLELPKHTFYVDNLYCTVPLPFVRTLYYIDVDLYHYYIGREGQSVQQDTMIRRIDQQIRVNKLMLDNVDLEHIDNLKKRETILHYHDMITAVTSIHLILGGTEEHLEKKRELWAYIRQNHPWEYRRLRYSMLGRVTNLPGRTGRRLNKAAYRIANRLFSFN